jgi:hypothetical protein
MANLYGTQTPIECQVTSWAYAQEGPLGNMVFRSYVIINKSSQRLDSMLVAMWSDPDLGFSDDDFAGCDTSLSLGYIYNAQNVDATYGALPPPASGFDFFQGPIVAAPGPATFRGSTSMVSATPMTSFLLYQRPDSADPAGRSRRRDADAFMRGRVGLTGQVFQDPQAT